MDSWFGKIRWRRERLPIPVFLGFLVAQLVRIHLQCGRPGFDPWVEKILWRRDRLPTPVFWPGENSMDCIVNGVSKSQTQMSNSHFNP